MPHARTPRPLRPSLEPLERRDVRAVGVAAHATPAAPQYHHSHQVQVAAPAVPQAHHARLVAADAPQGRPGRVHAAIAVADPFESLEIRGRADLRAGDILVTTGEGRVSKAIRDVTFSDYSHAALYVGGGRIIDATGEGVADRSLSVLTRSSTRIGIIRPDGLADPQVDRAVGTAHKLVGKPYNYLGLAVGAVQELHLIVRFYRLVTGEPFKVTGSVLGPGYFCSELVIKAYKTAGVTIAPESGDTPQGIIGYASAHPARFQLVGRLPPGRD